LNHIKIKKVKKSNTSSTKIKSCIFNLLSFADPDVQVRPEVSTVAAEAPEVELGRRQLSEDGEEREAQ
jgi:hypothetical protein